MRLTKYVLKKRGVRGPPCLGALAELDEFTCRDIDLMLADLVSAFDSSETSSVNQQTVASDQVRPHLASVSPLGEGQHWSRKAGTDAFDFNSAFGLLSSF